MPMPKMKVKSSLHRDAVTAQIKRSQIDQVTWLKLAQNNFRISTFSMRNYQISSMIAHNSSIEHEAD